MLKYSFQINGLERKQIASIISEVTGVPVKYAGPPSFAYEIGQFSIDRSSYITAPINEALEGVLTVLKEQNATASGASRVIIPMEDHSGVSLRNLINCISSKDKLIQRSLGLSTEIIPLAFVEVINSVRLEELEDFVEVARELSSGGVNFDFANKVIEFSFFNASLELTEIKAYAALCVALDQHAKRQKYTSFLQKEAENEKYTFRCFLLRLGFIGEAFKKERKYLLARLEGNGAFKNKEANIKEELIC